LTGLEHITRTTRLNDVAVVVNASVKSIVHFGGTQRIDRLIIRV
jgi:hypothetical protein